MKRIFEARRDLISPRRQVRKGMNSDLLGDLGGFARKIDEPDTEVPCGSGFRECSPTHHTQHTP